MSQSDKTRQKLVDSMRKTKSGNTGKSATVSADEPSKVQPRTQKAETPPNPKPAPKRSEKKPVSGSDVDSYQSARRRVWPD
ncbi:MAG: hypothetical protein PVG50_04055 [Thiohalophilus sp.]|jgi:hypothetical protein